MKSSNYFVGLDCGTNSVGWAVTDENYSLVKKSGRTLWGARLFETALTAQDRRMARSARRRTGRKAQRLGLLREIFSEEIAKKDAGFFARLDESKFFEQDKTVKTKYAIFADDNFNDYNYYKKYPTIYHLRSALAKGETENDVRLLFLGINHILKHRGHFLYEGEFEYTPDFNLVLQNAITAISDNLDISINCADIEKLKECICKKESVQLKKKQLYSLFECDDSREKAILDLLAGSKIDSMKIFATSDDADDGEALPKISFQDDTFENTEKCDALEKAYGDGFFMLLQIKALYDYGILANILKGGNYFAQAKVKIYEKHKSDLKLLKTVIKKHLPQEYYKLFRKNSDKLANYSAYVGYCKIAGKKQTPIKMCKPEDFFKLLKNILKDVECDDAKNILIEIEKGEFLPKQVSKENSVVPNQVNLTELKLILENNKSKFPFLMQVDENGISNSTKIEKLLTFRIPYYVGPLNDKHINNGFAWIVKNASKQVLPWNFDEIVNKEACAEKFIERLTATCTYLTGETVLPKDSILYGRFMVLNELNNLCLFGEKISIPLKKQIFDELFMAHKKVTANILTKWLINNGIISKTDKDVISGIDGDFKASRAIEIEFNNIFADNLPPLKQLDECIKVVLCLANEPAMLKNRLKVILPLANEKQIKQLANLRCGGWGRLSAKFLAGDEIVAATDETGEAMTILDALYNTNFNLMQLLSGSFNFTLAINGFNKQFATDASLTYENISELHVSPSVKRPIWQAIVLLKEIEKIMGTPPKKIFIEMARGAEEIKKRTISRKFQLLKLYESIKKDDSWLLATHSDKTRDWQAEITSRDEARYRSDKLYLYYTQMGKCMYTGEPIDLENLLNDKSELYDIDHIWPQSRIKDDSLENRVLVTKKANQDKKDDYPINEDIRNKQHAFWKALYDKKFIGKKKFDRLTRNQKFTEDELAGFIGRQLVETRQSTKELAKIILQKYSDTKIVYVKAGNVSDFRQLFDIVKLREINDLHHAQDAYLNVVVGNVYDTKFTNNPVNFIREELQKPKFEYSMRPEIIFSRDVKRGNTVAWNTAEKASISHVKKQVLKTNPMITYQCVERTSGQNGGFHDQNPVTGKENLLPLKTNDARFLNTQRYGGYSGDTGAYGFLVEHKKGKNIVKSIEFMSLMLKSKYEQQTNGLEAYCTQVLGLVEPRILVPKIKYNTIIKIKGFPICLTGKTGASALGKIVIQLFMQQDELKLLKAALKVAQRASLAKSEDITVLKAHDGIDDEDALKLYLLLLEKAKSAIYSGRPSSQLATLVQGLEKYKQISLVQKCLVIKEVLQLFSGKGKADLRLIGGSANAGLVQLSRTISEDANCKIITKSPTGFYTFEIDVQKL